jgi:hypothetical protein
MTTHEFGDYVRAKVSFPYRIYNFAQNAILSKVMEPGTWGAIGEQNKNGTWWASFFGVGGMVDIPSLDVLEFVPKEEYPPEGWEPKKLPVMGSPDFTDPEIGVVVPSRRSKST